MAKTKRQAANNFNIVVLLDLNITEAAARRFQAGGFGLSF